MVDVLEPKSGVRGDGIPLAFAGLERQVLESLPDGVVICDSTGRIDYVNRRAEELTGYKRKELIGQRIQVLVPEPLRAAHAHIALSPVSDSKEPHVVATVRDMTDRKTLAPSVRSRVRGSARLGRDLRPCRRP